MATKRRIAGGQECPGCEEIVGVADYWCRWCGSRLRGDAPAGQQTLVGEVSDLCTRSEADSLALPDPVKHSLRDGEECALLVPDADHWWYSVPTVVQGVVGPVVGRFMPENQYVIAPSGTFTVREVVEVAAVPAVDPSTPAGRDDPFVWRAISVRSDPDPEAGGDSGE